MSDCCSRNSKPNDLTAKKVACMLWYIPAALLFVGWHWPEARVWLWIPALLVMGGGCVANATGCGRLHCYFTGALNILSALYIVLYVLGIVPLNPSLFLLIVLGASCIAFVLEIPFGRYKRKEGFH
jgi:hypothetical protein